MESGDCSPVVAGAVVVGAGAAESDCTAALVAALVVLFVSLADLPVGFEVVFVLLGSPFVC